MQEFKDIYIIMQTCLLFNILHVELIKTIIGLYDLPASIRTARPLQTISPLSVIILLVFIQNNEMLYCNNSLFCVLTKQR